VKKSARKAVKWFTKAAKGQHAKATYALGLMHRNGGKGVRKDAKKALDYFTEAAEFGIDGAKYHLGNMLHIGDGVNQNLDAALSWYKEATKLADSQYHLGHMYIRGEGVDAHAGTALEWYTKAAKQGHVDAQFSAANLLRDGPEGVDTNWEEAIDWYNKAAEQNHVEGMFELARLLVRHSSDFPVFVKSMEWHGKAAARGHKEAARIYHEYLAEQKKKVKKGPDMYRGAERTKTKKGDEGKVLESKEGQADRQE